MIAEKQRYCFMFCFLFLILFLSACTPTIQTAKTVIEVPMPDGTIAKYQSGKNFQGIDATYTYKIDPKTGKVIEKSVTLKVDDSGTPRAAYKALGEQLKANAERDKAFAEVLKSILRRAPAGPLPIQ